MKKTKLAKTIALVIAGSALSVAAISTASAHTMYNTYNAGSAPGTGGTDGWTKGAFNGGAVQSWLGTSGGVRPFGYTSTNILNWAARIHGAGHSAQISAADADANYGTTPGYLTPDIDTAKGAWFDNSTPGEGWMHDLDMGLFKSDVTQLVTLNIEGLVNKSANYGFTIFDKESPNAGFYHHHASWNADQDGQLLPGVGFGFTAADIVATTDTSDPSNLLNLNTISFLANANQVYTIALGGWRDGNSTVTNDGYILDITTSPVPVPAAVWLFGTALAGLGVSRRKTKVVA